MPPIFLRFIFYGEINPDGVRSDTVYQSESVAGNITALPSSRRSKSVMIYLYQSPVARLAFTVPNDYDPPQLLCRFERGRAHSSLVKVNSRVQRHIAFKRFKDAATSLTAVS